MDLAKLQREQREWALENFGDAPAWQPLLGIVEEVGELAHAHLKQAQGIRTEEDHEADAKDAIGDIIIYLVDYCTRRGWGIGPIVARVWDEVKRRDWRKNPEGG